MALRIRKLFAEKKKAGEDFGKMYITNSVTLATCVRINIMRALAKKFATETTEMFVSSRPVMHAKGYELKIYSIHLLGCYLKIR
jgi:hypothetical protein